MDLPFVNVGVHKQVHSEVPALLAESWISAAAYVCISSDQGGTTKKGSRTTTKCSGTPKKGSGATKKGSGITCLTHMFALPPITSSGRPPSAVLGGCTAGVVRECATKEMRRRWIRQHFHLSWAVLG